MSVCIIIVNHWYLQIAAEKLVHFCEFKEYFQPLQLKGNYKKAILASIKVKFDYC